MTMVQYAIKDAAGNVLVTGTTQEDSLEHISLKAGEALHIGEFSAAIPPLPAPTYADFRRAFYPPIGDQLDALWKGGVDAQEMLAKVQAVKARFPK